MSILFSMSICGCLYVFSLVVRSRSLVSPWAFAESHHRILTLLWRFFPFFVMLRSIW